MKRAIAILLAAIMLVSLAACGAKAKTFSAEELSIELTDAFTEADYEGYTKSFDSSKVAVFVLREDKAQLGDLKLSLDEYAQLVYSANVNRNPQSVKKEGEMPYFEYEFTGTDNQTVFHYYTTMHESDGAFWIVQFAAKQAQWDKLKADVQKYAASVSFK